jgi:hypothetical protein
MPLIFYPHHDDTHKGTLRERIEVLMEAAERYKASITEIAAQPIQTDGASKRLSPRDLTIAFNWEEIAKVLHEIRNMPEVSKNERMMKGELLNKLAEVYEVLRAARMSKLEAVRLALISEANQLGAGGAPLV